MMLRRIARVSLWLRPSCGVPPRGADNPPPDTTAHDTAATARDRHRRRRPTRPPISYASGGMLRLQVVRLERDRLRFYLQIIGKRIDIHDARAQFRSAQRAGAGAGVTHKDTRLCRRSISTAPASTPPTCCSGLVNWLGQMAVKVVTGIADLLARSRSAPHPRPDRSRSSPRSRRNESVQGE